MKKVFALILALVMCCLLLAGCFSETATVKIHEDCTGEMTLEIGMTQTLADYINKMNNDGSDVTAELTTFYRNGVKYYGDAETVKFANAEELNVLFADAKEIIDVYEVKVGVVTMSRDEDGYLTLVVEADHDTGDLAAAEDLIKDPSLGLDARTAQKMLDETIITYTVEFPSPIIQTTGGSEGVTINGNTLTIDFIEMGKALNGKEATYTFTTKGAKVVEFTDVSEGQWFYTAVTAMANRGLVQGMGNDRFAPNDTLTYAQFCQIVAQAKNWETGKANNYWAAKAIQSCIDKDYMIDLGEINQKNYDKAIPREVAIAIMYKMRVDELGDACVEKTITAADIPDYNKISDDYKDAIVGAYNYGITSGMDANRTFNPQGNLTRAQICQLFYNLGWTSGQTAVNVREHVYKEIARVNATVKENGSVTYICSTCGNHYEEILPTIGSVGLTYKHNGDGTCTVVGIGTCTDTEILIPATFEGSTVTGIGEYAFDQYHSLTAITIPDGVTTIGGGAFRNCHRLAAITIPNSVTTIGHGAFTWCTSLSSIVIPNGVTSIEHHAFNSCTSLTSIMIPGSVTSLGHFLFANCENLSQIYFFGTKAHWEAFENDLSIPYGCTVYCSNGNINY